MLEVTNLVSGYGSIVAVRDASLRIEAGEVLALVGPNGAGKTTTIASIAGLIRPLAGSIRMNGADLTNAPARERVAHGVALVPEGRRVFANLSVDENLTAGGNVLKALDLADRRDYVFSLFPPLAERRQQLAGSLSGGEQQMLAIGRALMPRPRLLLIDELSLGLMPRVVDECYETLATLRAAGLAMVLVEQNTERALSVADHVVALDSGDVRWSGSGAAARADPARLNVHL